jgi:NTE family protein
MLTSDCNYLPQARAELINQQKRRTTSAPRKEFWPTWPRVRKLLVLFMCLSSTFGLTQDSQRSEGHSKVGLVLEGGGALGLAHIGVIQYLEEHHIPVRYIAGTSMGGLVGGLYATGRDAAELRDVVKGIKWDEVISGQSRFQDLSFRRKQDAREYPSMLEFGLHKGLQFPSGFNSGQQVDLILDRIALPYAQLESFDDLPIPFACVATDLVTRSEHVFRSGPLDLALRSTMSLPGIFSPVVHEGHIYIDGGLLNNFPVSVAKEMGADIVLGIHLEVAPLKSDASLSSFQVLGESIDAVIAANEREAMKHADLVVSVAVQDFSSMDYDKVDAIIQAGYDAAAANGEKLAMLSVDEESWKDYLTERAGRRGVPVTPQLVEVTGVNPTIAHELAEEMSEFAKQPVNSSKLDREILELNGTGPFSSLNYSMVQEDGKSVLKIDAQQKPYSPPIVRPLIVIDGSDYNDVFFSIGARVTFLNFGGYRRELRNDVIVGSQYGIASEYYRPFSPASNWFIAPRIGINSSQYPLYSGSTLLALYRHRLAVGGLDLGHEFGRTGELRFGYEGGYQRFSTQIGNVNELPTLSGATGAAKLQYSLNNLDDPVVPRSGESVNFYTKYYHANPGAPEGFPLSELQIQNFLRISDPSSVFLNVHGGTSYGYKTGIPAFGLGGVTRFVAFGENELLTNQYFLFQTGYIRKLTKMPPLLGSTIDFLAMFEVGKTYPLPNGPKPPNLPGDIAGALIVNTLFGPVELGGAVGDYGHAKFYFQIGRIF